MKRLIRLYINDFTGKLASAVGSKSNGVAGCKSITYGCGLLFNWRALWVGGHYSNKDKRLCVNLAPCLTFWWVRPGGTLP